VTRVSSIDNHCRLAADRRVRLDASIIEIGGTVSGRYCGSAVSDRTLRTAC
jgi:hypothetical protein